jgi:chemotaxis protein MotB
MPREKKCPKAEKGAPKWMVTFGDMMSLLLCFFVMMLSYSNMDQQKYKEVLGSVEKAFGVQKEVLELGKIGGLKMPIKLQSSKKSAEQEKNRLINLLESMINEEGLKKNILIVGDKQGVRMEIAGSLMFEPGKADLLPESQRLIKKMAVIFQEIRYNIFVEGHTDPTPLNSEGKFPSNWELSSARASSVARSLIKEGNLDDKLFTVIGHADTRPLFENTTPENQAKNRRVTIILEIF